jgi:hypothetical protein
VPAWLAYWAMAAAPAGMLTVVAMFTEGLSTYGFLIVPVGLSWTSCRRGGAAPRQNDWR